MASQVELETQGPVAGVQRTALPSWSIDSTRQSSSQTANGSPVAPASPPRPAAQRSAKAWRPGATSVTARWAK